MNCQLLQNLAIYLVHLNENSCLLGQTNETRVKGGEQYNVKKRICHPLVGIMMITFVVFLISITFYNIPLLVIIML